ncbi:MAG: MFS transporter [Candidatus Omnitrophota bacterium]
MTSDKKLSRGFHRNVIVMGVTSFFTDISSEMIYPILQGFVSVIMKSHGAFLGPVLGFIEGLSESTASLLKVFSGYYSDKWQKRKVPTLMGYGLSSVSKVLFLFPFWFTVLGARLFDRVGKGIRTAPRDALISESTPREEQGKAFGFQRAMDFAGASVGVIFCYFIVKYLFPDANKMVYPRAFYPIFAISLIPAFLGVVVLFFARDTDHSVGERNSNKPKPNLDFRKYDKNLKMFFAATFIFTLGNSSNQFLLLRSMNLGFALSSVLLMYIAFNFTTAILSTSFGKLSDKIGRKKPLIAGYLLYSVVYTAFGFITPGSNYLLWLFWPLYGVYYALTEGIEKAFVSNISPAGSKGTALGFFNTIVGIGVLPASLIAGFLFSLLPGAPFIFGGIMAAAAVVILLFFVEESRH